MRVTLLFVCLFVVSQVVLKSAQEISANILSNELNKVADSVGWSFLQVEIRLHTILYIAEVLIRKILWNH